jgi:hypothetical protein
VKPSYKPVDTEYPEYPLDKAGKTPTTSGKKPLIKLLLPKKQVMDYVFFGFVMHFLADPKKREHGHTEYSFF